MQKANCRDSIKFFTFDCKIVGWIIAIIGLASIFIVAFFPTRDVVEYNNSLVQVKRLVINIHVVDQQWTCYYKDGTAYLCWLVDITFGYRHPSYSWPDWIVRYTYDCDGYTKDTAQMNALKEYGTNEDYYVDPKTGEPFNSRPTGKIAGYIILTVVLFVLAVFMCFCIFLGVQLPDRRELVFSNFGVKIKPPEHPTIIV